MKEVALVKILWRNQKVVEAILEVKKDIEYNFPHLFTSLDDNISGNDIFSIQIHNIFLV